MQSETQFSTQISFESRSLSLGAAPPAAAPSCACLAASSKYGFVFAALGGALMRTSLSSLETALAASDLDSVQAVLPADTLVIGIALSADELTLAAHSLDCVFLFRVSAFGESFARVPLKGVRRVAWGSEVPLLCAQDAEGLHLLDQTGALVASRPVAGDAHFDWSPTSGELALAERAQVRLLAADLRELALLPVALPPLALSLCHLAWVRAEDADLLLLGCACECDGDAFVSVLAARLDRLPPLPRLAPVAYFEDVLQKLSADAPQTLAHAAIPPMGDVLLVSPQSNATLLLHLTRDQCVRVEPLDERRLTLPVGPPPLYARSTPTGLCLSLNASEPVFSVDRHFSPRPLLLLLSSAGALQLTAYVHRAFDASLCRAPLPLPAPVETPVPPPKETPPARAQPVQAPAKPERAPVRPSVPAAASLTSGLDASAEFRRSVDAFSLKVRGATARRLAVEALLGAQRPALDAQLQRLVRDTALQLRAVRAAAAEEEAHVCEGTALLASAQDVLRQNSESALLLDDRPDALAKSFFGTHRV